MKRLTIIIALFIISFGLSLVFAASSRLDGTLNSRSQQNRPIPPPPLPPRNSNGPRPHPTPRPSPCPEIRECTAAEDETPQQLQVTFPGPDGMTLHGHLYVPGVNTKAELAAVTK